MLVGAVILALAAGSRFAPPKSLTFVMQSQAHDRTIRLSDIAVLDGLPDRLKSRISTLPIADFAPNQTHVVLTSDRVMERVRAQLPAAGPWLPTGSRQRIDVVWNRSSNLSVERPSTSAAPCLRAVTSIAAGSFPVLKDFTPASCEATATKALRYDLRASTVRASRAISLGEVIVGASVDSFATVKPGQRVYLETIIGPVQVRREFEAVQPARRGQAFFAKASTGPVVSLPYPTAIQ